MNTSNHFLESVRQGIQRIMPDISECRIYDRRLNVDALLEADISGPSIYIVSLGIAELADNGAQQNNATHQLALYVLTKDGPELTRDAAARNIVDALLMHIANSRWEMTGLGAAEQIGAENLSSEASAAQGIAVWNVVWRQAVRLGESIWAESGVLPSRLYIGLEPDTGASHEQSYQEA